MLIFITSGGGTVINFIVYARTRIKDENPWSGRPYDPHYFETLREAESFYEDEGQDVLQRWVVCNYEPGSLMEASMLTDDDGELIMGFCDGGDGGCSKVKPMLAFLAKTFPGLLKQALEEAGL